MTLAKWSLTEPQAVLKHNNSFFKSFHRTLCCWQADPRSFSATASSLFTRCTISDPEPEPSFNPHQVFWKNWHHRILEMAAHLAHPQSSLTVAQVLHPHRFHSFTPPGLRRATRSSTFLATTSSSGQRLPRMTFPCHLQVRFWSFASIAVLWIRT